MLKFVQRFTGVDIIVIEIERMDNKMEEFEINIGKLLTVFVEGWYKEITWVSSCLSTTSRKIQICWLENLEIICNVVYIHLRLGKCLIKCAMFVLLWLYVHENVYVVHFSKLWYYIIWVSFFWFQLQSCLPKKEGGIRKFSFILKL